MNQPSLFNAGPGDEATLTDRQQWALHYLRRHPEGVPAILVGAHIHETLGHHQAGPCKWCAKDGQRVCEQLRGFELATRNKHGRWRATNASEKPEADSYDPDTAPFPEGF
jgi:hypothetical protein